jgi:predicted small metal-binding protein
MAKELRCADIGFACEATIRADTEEAVMTQAVNHAQTVHGLSETDLQQSEAAIRRAIRDV